MANWISCPTGHNKYKGSFKTQSDETYFCSITDNVKDNAFKDTITLTSIELPLVKTVGKNAFENSKLIEAIMPLVETVKDSAFYNNDLIKIDYPNLIKAKMDSFYENKAITINLPKILYAGDQAFGDNSHCTTLNINRLIEHIGTYAFTNTKSIGIIDFPNLKYIGYEVFTEPVIEYKIPNIEIVGGRLQNSNDRVLTFNKLKIIEGIGFSGLLNLEEVNAPNLEIIGTQAFVKTKIKKLIFKKVTEVKGNYNNNNKPDIDNSQLYFAPNGEPWTLYDVQLPLATKLPDSLFRNFPNERRMKIMLNSKFDSHQEKDRLFGNHNWDKITFDFSYKYINIKNKQVKSLFINNKSIRQLKLDNHTYTFMTVAGTNKFNFVKSIKALNADVLNGLINSNTASVNITKDMVKQELLKQTSIVHPEILKNTLIQLTPGRTSLVVNILSPLGSGYIKTFTLNGFGLSDIDKHKDFDSAVSKLNNTILDSLIDINKHSGDITKAQIKTEILKHLTVLPNLLTLPIIELTPSQGKLIVKIKRLFGSGNSKVWTLNGFSKSDPNLFFDLDVIQPNHGVKRFDTSSYNHNDHLYWKLDNFDKIPKSNTVYTLPSNKYIIITIPQTWGGMTSNKTYTSFWLIYNNNNYLMLGFDDNTSKHYNAGERYKIYGTDDAWSLGKGWVQIPTIKEEAFNKSINALDSNILNNLIDNTKFSSDITKAQIKTEILKHLTVNQSLLTDSIITLKTNNGTLKVEITNYITGIVKVFTLSGFKIGIKFKYVYDGVIDNPNIPANFLAYIKGTHLAQDWNDTEESKLTEFNSGNIIEITNSGLDRALITKLDLPLAITIGSNAFYNSKLTTLDLPSATTIGTNAFYNSKLTTLDLPSATTIGSDAFHKSLLTTLDLPLATTIGYSAFKNSPLTHLSLPKVTLIGDNNFVNRPFPLIINAPSTTVTLPKGNDINGIAFNSTKYKDFMFGPNNWDQITFTWV